MVLEALAHQFIEENRASHFKQHTQNNEGEVIQYGIPRRHAQFSRDQQKPEVLQPVPGRVVDPARVLIFLKGQHDPGHGSITENQHIDDGGNQHHKQQPVLAQVMGQRCLFMDPGER